MKNKKSTYYLITGAVLLLLFVGGITLLYTINYTYLVDNNMLSKI